MSEERQLTEEDREKIQRLLESGTLENVTLALSLIEETAGQEDIAAIFTKDVIVALICLEDPLVIVRAGSLILKCAKTWKTFADTLANPLVMTSRDYRIRTVDLSKVTAFSHGALAELANGYYSGVLRIDGLTSLSDAAAQSLSKHEGDLSLEGLTELSDGAAESLGRHEGSLYLDGLTELSAAAAKSLKHKGDLSLDGLASLSDAAAESLSKHGGGLSLNGLTAISDAVAVTLAKHVGALRHEGTLQLNGLSSLSDASAESLSRMFKDNLELNEELTEQLQNVRKKSDKEAVLTKTQKTKFAKLLKTKDSDDVQLVCELLNNVEASDEEWLFVFTPYKLKVLLGSWDTGIWNVLAIAMRDRVQLFEELVEAAAGRFGSYWGECHPGHDEFLGETIESGVVETFDLLDFSFRRNGFQKKVKGRMLGS